MARNNCVFNGVEAKPLEILAKSKAWISWGRGAAGSSLNFNLNFDLWKPPDKDYVKLNVDGRVVGC